MVRGSRAMVWACNFCRMSVPDINAVVSGVLRDLAAVQRSTQSRWGYKRTAAAIARLEQPLSSLVDSSGTLTKIPGIGPASTRVVLEVRAG